MATTPTTRTTADLRLWAWWMVLGGAVAVSFLWSYWPTLAEMVRRWARDPQYAHSFLVPVFSLVLLWLRRDRLAGASGSGSAGIWS